MKQVKRMKQPMEQGIITVALAAAVLGIAGCGSIGDSKGIDYKSARKAPSLEIPPDLTAPSTGSRYAMPEAGERGVATFSSYSADREAKPSETVANVQAGTSPDMHIERAGSERWLVVKGTPEQLWPEIRSFWIENGFVLNIDQPDIGVMETDWAENRAKLPQDFLRRTLGKVLDSVYSTPERDKFRTRLEPGKTPGTTEVYVSHRGMMEIYPNEAKDQTIWQPRAVDPELEAEMLSRLMVRLGAEEAKAKTLLATQATPSRATLEQRTDGSSLLHVQDDFDRAWRRVGLALDRSGFVVEDRDRAQGIYFVRYVDPEVDNATAGGGLLSKLAFWRDDKAKLGNASEYRVRVVQSGGESVVSILTKEGGEARGDTPKRILTVLQEQLR
ncbi:outer membrane protein assembly factor BamC [Cognatazoarcus halotolerans]|uniref:outer membrane protein assembly factor BamC n=1 Tax=Cognatazoarcus halotolerans TaxID=2686016 RepID=UPI003898F60A